MPVTSQDLAVSRLEAVVRTAQARIARFRDPDAPEWDTDPGLTVDELAGILREIEFAPAYPSLGRFVHEFLGTRHARQVTDTPMTVWCPQWWKHEEALWVFEMLWEGYEHVRNGGWQEMSDYKLHHVGPHMRELMHPGGPFKYCSVRNGHKDMLNPLPSDIDAAPAGLFADHPTTAIAA